VASSAESCPPLWVAKQLDDSGGQGVGVMWGHQQAGLVMDDHFGDAAGSRGDNGLPDRHCVEQRGAQSLGE
jgi:hypothetical protein